MSLHYLLDGYNIVHQMPKLTLLKLEEQRRGLIRFLDQNRPQGSLNNRVTVVFDGRSDVYCDAAMATSIKVVFSRGELADDKIKRMVAQSDHVKNIVVVTNDRAIQYAVRASGAKVMAVKDFIKRQAPAKRKINNILRLKPQESKKVISKIMEYKITDELEQIWLKKKKES